MIIQETTNYQMPAGFKLLQGHYALQKWSGIHTITEAVKAPKIQIVETIHKTRQSS